MSNTYTYTEMENAIAIAVEVALCIKELDPRANERLLEHVNGMSGMYSRIADWAREFEREWVALPDEDPRRDDWPIEIDSCARTKFTELLIEAERSFRRA